MSELPGSLMLFLTMARVKERGCVCRQRRQRCWWQRCAARASSRIYTPLGPSSQPSAVPALSTKPSRCAPSFPPPSPLKHTIHAAVVSLRHMASASSIRHGIVVVISII